MSTVADASGFLLDHSANNDSHQWIDAINQCAGAGLGTNSVADAGSAFIAALKAAGIQIDTTVSLY